MNQNSTLSFGGEYGDFGFGWDNFLQINEYTDPSNINRYYRDDNIFRWTRYYYSLNTNFKQEFNQDGHELNVFAFYSRRDGEQRQEKQEIDTDEFYNPINNDVFLLRSIEAGPSNRIRIEVDYTKPVLNDGRFEAGYQFRRSDEIETYDLETFDYDFNEWVSDEKYYKKSLFERNIHAVYSTFAHEVKGFQYQVGLRGEYTYRDITVENTGESALVDRFDFFPTFHLSKRIAEKNQLMASYSRRIDRPRGWYLEPFETYVDESTRRIGNPALLPEYTGSYELGYLRTLKNGTFSAETYFRQTNNKITGVQYFDEENGLIYREYQNLNNDRSLGAELSTIYDISEWFNVNVSGTYYYYQVEDLTSETSSYRTSNNWDARLITAFKMPTQTRIQVFFGYQSASVTAQGRREANNYTDITVRQDFLNNALSATLRVSDIFGSRIRESFTQGENLYVYERSVPEARVITLTVSYKLNNFKMAPSKVQADSGM
jgi:outer membrane receptor protein involved in Fe transport